MIIKYVNKECNEILEIETNEIIKIMDCSMSLKIKGGNKIMDFSKVISIKNKEVTK